MPLNAVQARPLAARIASGHAWIEHRAEFAAITNTAGFIAFIESILLAPDAERQLPRGRTAYWHDSSGTIVLLSPNDPDRGTCFKPAAGRAYFDNLV
jgi:hypothetical protein